MSGASSSSAWAAAGAGVALGALLCPGGAAKVRAGSVCFSAPRVSGGTFDAFVLLQASVEHIKSLQRAREHRFIIVREVADQPAQLGLRRSHQGIHFHEARPPEAHR